MFLATAKKTWPMAKSSCEGLSARMVTIKSAEENEFVKSTFLESTASVWIGLSDAESEGQWVWVDNTPLVYNKWEKRQPSGSHAENCAVIGNGVLWNGGPQFDGHWNDVNCTGFTKPYICEITAHQ